MTSASPEGLRLCGATALTTMTQWVTATVGPAAGTSSESSQRVYRNEGDMVSW